jgi:hypothetical protein
MWSSQLSRLNLVGIHVQDSEEAEETEGTAWCVGGTRNLCHEIGLGFIENRRKRNMPHTCVRHSRTKAHASSSSPGGSWASSRGVPLPKTDVSHTNSTTVDARMVVSLDFDLQKEPSENVILGLAPWIVRDVLSLLWGRLRLNV